MKKNEIVVEQFVDKIVRNKIFESKYYKEKCFGLNAETLIDRSSELEYAGGTYGGLRNPTPFLCIIFKMLQNNLKKEIIKEFIRNKHYKYLSILGCVYLRLVGKPKEIYFELENLLLDYRKIRVRSADGKYSIRHVDEIVDDLLTHKYYFDLNLPYLPKRIQMEEQGLLEPRVSPIEEFLSEQELNVKEEKENDQKNKFKLSFKKSVEEEIEEEIQAALKGGKGKIIHAKEKKRPGEESISISETNELRKKLGLPPLQM